ncbi:S8 family serine peptidase [Paraburkholderia sp. CNPSo 3157]|uniref:S8 family serine peptidase n=1 Tax=Paraburkholderia franconis TaxID=2654983 RepID=A0A7X1NF14_9BURK|nr:S8 family serine peptidase [Paraburkholderia franconis]MPW20258.1 S8 family serine peptidase [Paraburkholderia franconis]
MTWQSLTGKAGAWSGLDWTGRANGVARADPYLAWADATLFADLGGPPAGWVRVIIELEVFGPDGTPLTAQSFAESLESTHAAWKAWLRVSSLYRYPPRDLAHTHFLTAAVTKVFFAKLDTTLKGFVKRFELGMPIVPDDQPVGASQAATVLATGTGPQFAAASQAKTRAAGAKRERMVFLGVMDDGLAFAHERFRSSGDPSATRIEYFWNQDDAPGTLAGLHYGRELSKAGIDDMLARYTQGGLIDEDAVHREAGYIGVRKRWAHGTEAMDLAGGVRPGDLHAAFLQRLGDETKALEKVRLIGVQFRTPGRTVRDTSGLWFATHALDAMRYILRRADDLAQSHGHDYCVVLNLSYGYMAGAHDGSSIIERAIDELIDQHRDLCVVVPAGNSNVLRCHANVELAHGESKSLTWRVLPDCATPSFLEIWLPEHADPSKVKIQVCPPTGDKSPAMSVKNFYAWQPGSNVLCASVYLDRVATGDNRMILIALAPTITRDPSRDATPAGNWSVTVSNTARRGEALNIHAWVQRNETAFGYPMRGRQSRFDDPLYKRFISGSHVRDFDKGNTESWIRRSSTLSSIATGDYTVVVGAYRRTDGKAALYSSTGPSLRTKQRNGPDATAVSEDSPACAGVLGASTRSGSLAAITGTSAAAPQVSRLFAQAKVTGEAAVLTPMTAAKNASKNASKKAAKIAAKNAAQIAPTTKPLASRKWIEQKATDEDPATLGASPHELVDTCPATARPPTVPVGEHAWLPKLPAERGGAGRFKSRRSKKRGIDP